MPTSVRFAHRRDGKYPELIEFFGDQLEFGATADDVSFDPSIKTMPIVSADRYSSKFLIKAMSPGFSIGVSASILSSLTVTDG